MSELQTANDGVKTVLEAPNVIQCIAETLESCESVQLVLQLKDAKQEVCIIEHEIEHSYHAESVRM